MIFVNQNCGDRQSDVVQLEAHNSTRLLRVNSAIDHRKAHARNSVGRTIRKLAVTRIVECRKGGSATVAQPMDSSPSFQFTIVDQSCRSEPSRDERNRVSRNLWYGQQRLAIDHDRVVDAVAGGQVVSHD